MPITISKLLIHPFLWRILGFGSSIVGFTCYALSPSFFDLFGKLSLLKIVIYSVISLISCTLMLFVKKCRGFTRNVLARAHVGFLVLMLTSLYSFWEDRASQQGNEEKGSHGRILNLSSCGAFGLMSLSLSRQLELGFEVGIFNFFVGCFLVTLMKMNFKLAPVAAFLCYVLINIRSFSDFLLEVRRRRESGDTLARDIESGPRDIHYLQDSDSDSNKTNANNTDDDEDFWDGRDGYNTHQALLDIPPVDGDMKVGFHDIDWLSQMHSRRFFGIGPVV